MLRTLQGELRRSAHTPQPVSWWFAAALVVVESVASLTGLSGLGLAAAALVAPGFALAGLLPGPLRRSAVARIACAPVLGLAVTSVTLISLAQLGVPLTSISVHLTLAVLVGAGWFVPREPPVPVDLRGLAIDGVLVGALLLLGAILGWRVVGDLPVPGDDWAKYLLYADEIRHQGSLLLDNRLWMAGRPFSEDPGVPALEGAALLMTGAPAGALVRVVLVLSLLQVATLYGVMRALVGRSGAVVAAGLLAVVPASQNILGWHGLANVGALAIFVLVLAQLGVWLAGGLDRRAELGLALTLVGVVAAHRLTALFLAGTLVLVLLAALAAGPRGPLLRSAGRVLALGIPCGALVALDALTRARASGGTLPYTSYLVTKIDLGLALRDLTVVLAGGAVLTVLVLGARGRLPRLTWPAVGLALVALALSYGWVVHVPLYYSRTTFFLPIPLAILAGAGAAAVWASLVDPRGAAGASETAARSSVQDLGVAPPAPGRGRVPRGAALAGTGTAVAAIFGVLVVGSWRQAEDVRQFYAFASPQALGALDVLADRLRPDEIIATDRCWSFLATWLVHTRTYPALEEQDIQPRAELLVARRAAAMLHGTPRGRELIDELGVRYAVLDPTCPVTRSRFQPPGRIVFASERLAIVALDSGAKPAKALQ